jgi:hypothetical protein
VLRRIVLRRVFYSFHFENDFWRTQQVRNIGSIQGQSLASANDWEQLKRNGKKAIQNWIDCQLKGKSCLVVLVGAQTADRPWVRYEIEKAWSEGKGVLGIHINKLKDSNGRVSPKGRNPFYGIKYGQYNADLGQKVTLHTPVGVNSRAAYASIQSNIAQWIEDAVQQRKSSTGSSLWNFLGL